MTIDFWSERFWLPNNITWADLRDTPLAKYPQIEDLLFVIPVAIVVFIIRSLFERLVAQPIGTAIGISARTPRKLYPHPILERVFLTITQKPDEKRLRGLEKQLDCWTQYRIKQWFALRRVQLRPSKMSKFKESLWKLIYCTTIVGYGLYVFSEEDFFYDLSKCWKDYPFQPLSTSIRNYYIVQLSFYVSHVLALLLMKKRKSFRPMLMHHVVAMTLMFFSYVVNFVRIGCIVLIAHDIADVWLETVRLLNYTKCGRLTNFVFAIFAVYFIATRLIYFPFWLINATLIQSLWLPNFGFFPAYVVFNFLLLSLLSLHLYWAVLFGRLGWNMLYSCSSSQSTATSGATSNSNVISAIYSDSCLSDHEFYFNSTDDFPLKNSTYWFTITPTSGANGTIGGSNGNASVGVAGGGTTLNVIHANSNTNHNNVHQSNSLVHNRNAPSNGAGGGKNGSGKATYSSNTGSSSSNLSHTQNGIHTSNGHAITSHVNGLNGYVSNGHIKSH